MYSESEAATGILYTEYAARTALAPYLTSCWSFESRRLRPHHRRVALNDDGNREVWLDRSDPLLNVILPDTGLSLIANFASPWAAGRSLASAAYLPRVCVVGPVSRSRILRLGRTVRSVGLALDSSIAPEVLGVRASQLLDRIVPLDDLWGSAEVEACVARLCSIEFERRPIALEAMLARRFGGSAAVDPLGRSVSSLIRARAGRISITEMTRLHGISRQRLARRFRHTSGLSPKTFARTTRFQALVQALLATDVAEWARRSTSLGYYDQAHMINEFRCFAGAPPTRFFQRRGPVPIHSQRQLTGRPSEWFALQT